MKILFLNPNLRPGSPTGKYLPVGLGSVMTFVRDHGIEFDLLDITINDHDDAYVERFIKDHDYDVFLMGSIVTHYKWIKWCIRTIKRHHPKSKVVVGNSVAGSIPDLLFANAPVDIVVIGEGEHTCLEALERLKSGQDLSDVQGIAYRDASGAVKKNPRRKACDINSLPMIDWSFFDVDGYYKATQTTGSSTIGVDGSAHWRSMPVVTARGCAFKCTFCHYVFWNDPYRHRSVESVLAECSRNFARYGANYFNFWDDLSFSSLHQAETFVDGLLASEIRFKWDAAIRADLFGNPRIDYAKRRGVAEKFLASGCVSLGFSLESGNAEILKLMNKHIEAPYFEEQVKLLREVGIAARTSVVFGYPIETPETIRETFDYCERLSIYPSVGFLLPLPSTGMYQYALEHGFIEDEDAYLDSITERQDICLNMTEMKNGEIIEALKDGCRRLNTKMNLGLSEDSFIRTGGYKRHTKVRNEANRDPNLPVNVDEFERSKNDFSFNYSKQTINVDPLSRADLGKKTG